MLLLTQHEKILFQAMPFDSLRTVLGIFACIIVLISIFPSTLLVMKYLILYLLLGLLTLCRCFDKITITNQRIILKILLIHKIVRLDQLKSSPYLSIHPHTFKKYEWQRKLLKKQFHQFWQDKALIYFPQEELLHGSTFLNKHLVYLRLGLFSKKQTQQIIEILIKTWQLEPTIRPSENQQS